jgi:hypothetical protein
MSEDRLSQFLKTGPDWGRMKTSVAGLFILKLPAYRNTPARIAVELNPVDDSGSPTKKRGLVIRSSQDLAEYLNLLQYDKLPQLLVAVDKVNPPLKKAGRSGEEVLEI